MNTVISMGAFALASSISPGPVNLVALSSSMRHGFKVSMRHVIGATIGFTVLLLLTGLGMRELLNVMPRLIEFVKWAGCAFLIYMAYKLVRDNGELGVSSEAKAPSFLSGATMQWLNPKAWLASLAGMGAFAGSDIGLIWQLTCIYFAICLASLACWSAAGIFLRKYIDRPARMRLFNRMISALLVFSAVYLMQE
ncbi:LysE family translocator [Caballeronia sp. BR00000012568055]|uniref:LysE family translocator n=1 Tax=Caballeronia sp. BR00000012568055 TaxID=2918761 RepID=UPI0023F7CED3|nr:LysE family translocator [Caballeronia sp. BR00000012568055]